MEQPVSLSPSCIRAILAGRKTQLRMVDPSWAALRDGSSAEAAASCPVGGPGDLLWVREAWAPDASGRPLYRAGGEIAPVASATAPAAQSAPARTSESPVEWRPPRSMPREASRLLLRIRRTRRELLQTISAADLAAEGGPWRESALPGEPDRAGFARWWDQVQDQGAWGENPPVWVVEFERVTGAPPPGAP
jgi:hypothetical protein